MQTSNKQIYVSLQIDESKIKILVGEYFNTRFNIIRSDYLATSYISDFKILDKEGLKQDISKLVEEVSEKIGTKIEKIILVLPCFNFKRFPLTSNVLLKEGYVLKSDVERAINNSLRSVVEEDAMIINPVVVKYNVNGIHYRRLPEKEVCDQMDVDIDLLCCDKQMAYEYVSVVESLGITVLDVCLNNYAIAVEASLLEESNKRNVVLLDIHSELTYLSLLTKGKLVSTEIIYEGLEKMMDIIYDKYHIPYDEIEQLVKYSVSFKDEQENVVYAYSVNNKSMTISNFELSNLVKDCFDDFVEKLMTMCKPIIENKDALLVITGDGQEMSALVESIQKESECDVKAYYPDTIGVRDSNLSALLGSFVVYKEKALLNDSNVNCVDLLEYNSKIDQRKLDSEGETFTTKIKNFFNQYINREDQNQ